MLAVAGWAVAGAALVDLALRGRDLSSLTVALGAAALAVALWVGLWRPGLRLFRDSLVLTGPARVQRIPLAAVTGVELRYVLRIAVGDRTVTTSLVTSSPRAESRARFRTDHPGGLLGSVLPGAGARRLEARGAPDPRVAHESTAPSAGDYALDRIREEAARARRERPGSEEQVRTRWSWAPLAVTGALVLATVVTGLS